MRTLEEAEKEIERLKGVCEWWAGNRQTWVDAKAKADAGLAATKEALKIALHTQAHQKATLDRVRALAEEWEGYGHGTYNVHPDVAVANDCGACAIVRALRAILDAPQAEAGAVDLLAERIAGRCIACNRATWDADDIGHQCLMPQPDGSQCPGCFEPEAGGESDGGA